MVTKQATAEEDVEWVGEMEEAGTHCATNPNQAVRHVQALDSIMDQMEARGKEEDVQNIIREALEQVKAKIVELVPQMQRQVWQRSQGP